MCSPNIQGPGNFAAYPISDSQALLAWGKPLGEGYVFQVIYRLDAAIRIKKLQELQGFGPMDMVVISGLKPSTKYHAEIRFYCGLNSYYASYWISTTFTTFGPRKRIMF